MSAKYQTTKIPEELPNNMGERQEAQTLSIAFAVIGKLIGEGFIHVEFNKDDWEVLLRLQVQTVAEVLYDYQ